MALSGTFQSFPVKYLGLYCSWSAKQSITGNYSDVTLNVYLKHYSLYVGARSDSTISINGQSEQYTAQAISEGVNSQHTTFLKSKTVRVYHDQNGDKNGVELSASWRFSGTYSGVYINTITASDTISLTRIDRTAPSVSCSVNNITANGFRINATSSATADLWEYSLNDGSSWTQFSTSQSTSAYKDVTGLKPSTTYSVRARARKKTNHVYGTSGRSSVTTLGGAVLNSCSNIEADADTVSFDMNVTVYNSSYTYYVSISNTSNKNIISFDGQSWGTGTSTKKIELSPAQKTDLLEYMSSVKSFTAVVKIVSMNGDTQIGQASTKNVLAYTTPEKSAPVLSGFSFMDTDEDMKAITGNDQYLIQGYSQLGIVPGSATAKNGASISNFVASCGDTSKSSTTQERIDLGAIMSSGERDIVLTVADSRGYTSSITKKVTVIPYQNPVIKYGYARRTNDIEDEIQLYFDGTISTISVGGSQKNSVTSAKYRYKSTGTDIWGAYSTISVNKAGSSFSFEDPEFIYLDSNSSYDLQVSIEDRVSSSQIEFLIPQGTPLVSFRRGRVGINKPTPECAFDVEGDVSISGGLKIGGVLLADILYPVGSVYTSVSSTNPGQIFGGEWEQITNRFLYCSTTSKQTGGNNTINLAHTHTTAGHTLTLNEIPSHTHSTNIPIANYEDTGSVWACRIDQVSSKWSGTANATGGGKSHSHGNTGSSLSNTTGNNMPAYFTVYAWYRTA